MTYLEPSEEYCAYLRKSRGDRDMELHGETDILERHKQILTEYAAKNHITIKQFYCEVVSGETIDDRPEMQKLLSDVEAGKWNGVLVVEVERLARGNTKDQGIVADAFKYSNTRIITPVKTYDPENEFDEEYFEFGLFMSRREYKTINRRLQRGRLASVKEGKFVGSTAPYGYSKVKIPHDKGYTLEIIPEQADIVRLVYEWYCHGELLPDGTRHRLGTDAIAARLDIMGIKPAVNDNWSKATIADMLRNKTYVGYVFFGKQKEVKSSVNGKVVKLRKSNPDYLCVKGLHPAIVDEQTFELASLIRRENRKNTLPSSQVLQNPLAGIVFCKKCGKMMTRLAPNKRNHYATMKCVNRYCDNVSSPIFLLEEQLLLFLRSWVETYELNNKTITALPIYREIENKQALVLKIQSEIDGLRAQLNKAYDFLEKEIYTVEVFKERQMSLNKNIEQLTSALHTAEEEVLKLEHLRSEKELYFPKVQHLLETYHLNDVETNNQILHEIIEKVYYSKDTPNRRGGLRNANFNLEVFPKIPI